MNLTRIRDMVAGIRRQGLAAVSHVTPGRPGKPLKPGQAAAGGPEAARTLAARRRARLEPGALDVRARLLRSGASRALTERVLRVVRASGRRGAFAIDAAAHALGRAFAIRRSPKRRQANGQPFLITLVGAGGAGKTTTLAKLARRLSQGGRKVVVASLDGALDLERIGGVQADSDRAEVPIQAVRGAADVRRLLKKHTEAEVLLLDTPGVSLRKEADIARLARELRRITADLAHETFLVLPATASQASLQASLQAFAPLHPSACILTKLDETVETAVALEESQAARLPVAFLCDGQDIRSDLWRPTPGRLADLVLRGHWA